jgi:acetone carboxylase gamma subunit
MRCSISMRWFMSKLVRQDPVDIIVHRFACPDCEGIHEVESEFEPVRLLPDRPAQARPAAGAAGG